MAISIPIFSAQAANGGLDLLGPMKRVLHSQSYILGVEVASFEREFAEYCGVDSCIALGNGTDALELGLRGLEVSAGDKVLVTANAGFYGSAAIRLIGAIPHYVEIDPITLSISVEDLQKALKEKPKAIIITHLYGQLADMVEITRIAAAAGVPVLEDCAQAHGARRGGKKAGSYGKLGCFSFYPTKNLGALGDGGAIVTSDEALALRLRQMRQYGWSTKYHVELPHGRNSRMDEIQAAILREKLPFLDGWNSERREIAHRYNAAFSELPVACPSSLGEDYVAHLYVIRTENRDSFREFLKGRGISTDVHYPVPDHKQAGYSIDPGARALPVTEETCARVVTLPCYPGLDLESVKRVIHTVELYFGQAGV